MPDRIKNEKFTRKIICLLAQIESMSSEVLSGFYSKAGFKPDIQSWVSFVTKFLLSLGILFTVCGVIFFFAYNWNDLHKFAKLLLVCGAIVVPAIITLRSDLNKLHSKLSLFAVACFTGCLLAVFGQIYQTGANAYDLFLSWAILITGIVFISKFKPLWFLWLILINISISLFYVQILECVNRDSSCLFISLFFVNLTALSVYEYFSLKNNDQFVARWFPRAVGLITIVLITVAASTGIFLDFENSGYKICVFLAVGSYCGAFFLYSRKIYDLFSIVISCVCIIAIVFCFRIKSGNHDFAWVLFSDGVVVVALTIVSAIVITKINNAWKERL